MPCACCCGECDSPCCGTANPVSSGECCGGEWRTGAGTCCADVWQTGAGICCGGVWQTGAGECCGGVWQTGEGECCEGVWYPAVDPCPEGETYTTWGPDDICCGCLEDPEDPPDYCPGDGPPKACCSEDSDGLVSCNPSLGELRCVAPSVPAVGNNCATGCLGACCVDGVATQTTQADCTGCWAGLGTTECLDGCRDPFTSDCCESAVSAGAGITFTQPRYKRCPPFAGTFRVTVTGHTDSPVLVHGTPFGAVGKRCPINHSFLLCWDKFNIEPVPCDTDFIELDVTVCWEEEATATETLNFSGCSDLTVWLGACDYGCVTTLVYSGAGHTSNVSIQLYGNGVIEANGSDALVLAGNIVSQDTCVTTLTLKGTSTYDNEISGVIQNSTSGLSVVKEGTGLWRLSGTNTFTKKLHVKDGTLVIAAAVGNSGASPIGNPATAADLPLIGDTSSGATFLLDAITFDRGGWSVAAGAGTVVIGGTDGSVFAVNRTTKVGRDITLQAESGGTVEFGNLWQDLSGVGPIGGGPAVAFTMGTPGNDGVVFLKSFLPDSLTAVVIANGTVKVNDDETIWHETPTSIGTATFDRNGFDQPLDDLAVTGTATLSGSGTITVDDTLSGSGSIVNSAGDLVINAVNTMSGSMSVTGGTVTVGTIVSGPAIVTSAVFDSSSLTVNFSATPDTGDQFKLLYGSTVQTYTPVLVGAGGKTGTYDSTTSTLTIS